MNSAPKITAAIVAYRPDPATLRRVVAAIAPQVAGILVIANDDANWAGVLPPNAIVAKQDTNIGLGAAHNLAVRWARRRDDTHLLLLDQDSIPAPDMVAALLPAFAQGGKVAAAGPLWRDARTGEDGFFVRLGRLGVERFRPAPNSIAPVDFLISSGSLIRLEALAEIGPFDSELFIEHVDTDWSLRAKAKGYRLYGVANARLDHAFGEATLTAPPLGLRRRFFLYPPERNYYLLRNSMMLWRRPYAPWRWVWHDLRRTVLLMLFYLAFVPPRWERLKRMTRAVRDACRTK